MEGYRQQRGDEMELRFEIMMQCTREQASGTKITHDWRLNTNVIS